MDLAFLPDRILSLRAFFAPSRLAVVGASRNPASIGYRSLDAILRGGYTGTVYPVNRNAKEVCGIRAYASVRDLPEAPDMALIAVPRDCVLSVVDDCAQRGVKAVTVLSAGFAETGPEGKALQEQLLSIVHAHGMRMVGPNCLGLLTHSEYGRLDATFVSVFPPAGRVAISSDSGALGLMALATAARLGLGVSQCVCVGNRADVSSNDLLEYWEHEPTTDVILLYLESFGNPLRFAEIARRVSLRKPIVAVKSGRSSVGSRAISSHTAALAAPDIAVDALFHQAGVLRAEGTQELFDLGVALACQPLPRGRRVAIVTNAGGPGILCADACESNGLSVVELSAATKEKLAEFLPAMASVRNPVDMIASACPDDYSRTLRTLLESGEVDAVIAIYLQVGSAPNDAVTKAIREAIPAKSFQPVFLCYMPDHTATGIAESAGVRWPCYPFPETAANVLAKMAKNAEWRAQPLGSISAYANAEDDAIRALCRESAKIRGESWLTVSETRQVLQHMGLPLSAGGVARTAEEAAEIARTLGFPVAVKLASHRIVHKTEIGGVKLDMKDETAVRGAFEEIRTAVASMDKLDAMEGVLVQPMVKDGSELVIGVNRDPQFGPLIAFGLGGIHVEILRDVVFRMAPLTDRDAAEMVRGIRGFRLLQGYRGHAPADLPALEETLQRISRLVEAVPEIAELDLNPVMALPPGMGCRIVDARIRVKPV